MRARFSPLRRLHTTASLAALLVAALLPALAFGQVDTRPKLYIVFDTSGSMLASGKDGTKLCGDVGKNSRIYQLKTALFEVLQGMGATEIDFALATFPQAVDPTLPGTSCPGGHYQLLPAQQVGNGGGCKVTLHDESLHVTATCSSSPCPWYQAFKQEVLRVPFGASPQSLMLWVDGLEDEDGIPPLDNPEVRAATSGANTPLGHSLFYAYGYFDKEIVLPASDYRKKCEKLAIALFTDGNANCGETSSSPFFARGLAGELKSQLGVTVNTVGIDLNSTNLAQIALNGGGTYIKVTGDATSLKTALLDLIAKSLPASELCNGADDDCDNDVDEDYPLKGKTCTNGAVGQCFRAGVYVCKADGSGVECDAPDVTPGTEVCNGLDDDCDGKIDEDVPGGCQPCVPQREICNGLSDDCDAEIDEDIPSAPCGSSVGQCAPGKTQCINGQVICEGAQGPSPEICNGLDDDCDGVRDGFSEACYQFQKGCDPSTGVCQGSCRLGIRNCPAAGPGEPGGIWSACSGSVGPGKEICDGIDNNCDGLVDEGAECPGGGECLAGACSIACGGIEFGCPAGFICQNGWCIENPCKGITCGQNEVCKAGACVDVCAGRACKSWEKCVQGRCEDQTCYNPKFACPAGEKCIGGACKKAPCDGVSCGPDEFCYQGECRPICETLTCAKGQRCEHGKCVKDPCAEVSCKGISVCAVNIDGEGACIADPCLVAPECPKGQKCTVGAQGQATCVVDPCEETVCPRSYRCVDGDCTTGVVGNTFVLATGSGGVACAVGRGERTESGLPTTILLVLLALLPLLRRRSRGSERD